MAALEFSFDDGGGNEQHPPYPATDGHFIKVRYRNGWNDSLSFVTTQTSGRKEGYPGGAYKVRAYGIRSSELSQEYSEADCFLSGDSVDAVFDDPPAQGNPEIAAPTNLSVAEGA